MSERVYIGLEGVSLGPQPQLVKCGRARSGCEMTRGNFEVEVLGIYGRRELCRHGSGARPVSDGPYQPVDAADVRRRAVFGARQDNEFAVRTAACNGLRWSTRTVRAMPPRHRQTASRPGERASEK